MDAMRRTGRAVGFNLGVALRFNHRGTFTWFRMDKFVAGFGFGKRPGGKNAGGETCPPSESNI